MTKRKLSQTHTMRLGKMVITKGPNECGDTIYAWDVVQRCTHENCPASLQCQYKSSIEEEGERKVMRNYIRSISMVLVQEGEEKLSALKRYQIGMHIIPLYKTLCKLKIEEVGVERIVTETPRGTLVANPLYKEMRETVKAIDQMWRNLDWSAASAEGVSPKFQSDTSYYDAMEKQAFAEMSDKVRPLRKKRS